MEIRIKPFFLFRCTERRVVSYKIRHENNENKTK